MTDDTIHVLPVNDSAPHRDDGTPCWCQPRIEVVEGGEIAVHHSADGRELSEHAAIRAPEAGS